MHRRFPQGMAALISALALVATISPEPAGAADPPQLPRTFFSVGPQTVLNSSDIARMSVGGIGRLRITIPWAAIDPDAPAGGLDWGDVDAVVGEAAKGGVAVLPVLFGTPTWVAQADGNQCYPGCQVFLPQSDVALGAWRAFVAGAVERYGPGGTYWTTHPSIPPVPMRAWQIWNEQNSGQYTQPQGTVKPYARMLSVASRTIHRIDPAARVVLGGMFHDPVSDTVSGMPAPRYLRKLYRRPHIEDRFDGIAVHPYSYEFSGVAEQVEDLRRVAEEAGDPQATTWVTEIGWASGGIPHPLNKGPIGQARMLRRSFRLFIDNRERWRVRVVSWFSWRDSVGTPVCRWCPESGLFDAAYGLQPKPAWQAFVHFSGGA